MQVARGVALPQYALTVSRRFLRGGGSGCRADVRSTGGLGMASGVFGLIGERWALSANLPHALEGAIEAVSTDAKHLRGAGAVSAAHFDDALDVQVADLLERQGAHSLGRRH